MVLLGTLSSRLQGPRCCRAPADGPARSRAEAELSQTKSSQIAVFPNYHGKSPFPASLGAGADKAHQPLSHTRPRKREERLRKALQARERVEQMEEEKKKRMEQKILQNDEKVRGRPSFGLLGTVTTFLSCGPRGCRQAPGTTCAGTGLLLVTNHVVGKCIRDTQILCLVRGAFCSPPPCSGSEPSCSDTQCSWRSAFQECP